MERNFSIFIFKEKEKLVQRRSFVAILTEFYFFAKIKNQTFLEHWFVENRQGEGLSIFLLALPCPPFFQEERVI